MKKLLQLFVLLFVWQVGSAQTCDTLSHIFVDDTLRLYGAGTGETGYLAGHNSYGDLAKAEKFFNALPGGQIAQTYYYFGAAESSNPNAFITATIWTNNATTGFPGAVLGTKQILISDIISDVAGDFLTPVTFNPPVTVQDTFYVGFSLNYTGDDTVGLWTNSAGDALPKQSYELWSDGTSWAAISDAWTNATISLAINPIICPPPAPVAEFTANQTSIPVGGSVNFTDLSTGSPTSWAWTFSGAATTSSTQQNPAGIVYNTPGNYTVSLTATNATGSDIETKVAYITVTNLVVAPVADFVANQTTINAGGSVSFTDLTTNSPTSWAWVFAGGTPGTSAVKNPANIVYNTPGTYTVTLTASNTAGSDNEVKTGYIIVNAGNNTFIDCDTFLNFDITTALADVINLAGTGATGYISGHNSFGDLAKADFFVNPNPGTPVSTAVVAFALAKFSSATDSVAIRLWDANGAGGGPGTLLASRNVAYSTIAADVTASRFTTVAFPTNPNPAGNFFVGVSYTYGAGDTIAIYHTEDSIAVTSGTAWEQWSVAQGGGWHAYNEPGNWGLDVSHFIGFEQCPTVPCPSISATTTSTNAVCTATNGTATAAGTGGVAPYTYRWGTSPVQNTATATGLTAGTYLVTITDANGCSGTASRVIGSSTNTIAPNITTTSAVCTSVNGSATAAPTGGTAPYAYLWNNSLTTATISNIAAGTYTVTITDANGCSVTGTATVGASSGTLSATTSTTPATCTTANGTATVSLTGGTPNYTYLWGGGQSTATITGLAANTYNVTVTDANGCSLTRTAVVTASAGNLTAAVATTNASCGQSNGTATATAAGGNGPFTYTWTPTASGAVLNNLAAGSYTVTITDANGCSATATGIVTSPSAPVITFTNQTNINCFGQTNGSLSISVSSGTTPYTYLWSTGGTGNSISNLATGTYTVTVTDGSGCAVSASRTITGPSAALAASIVATTPVSCAGANNGSITVSATGGTTAYTFSWNTSPVQINATATGLAPGNYAVTVTDANGCSTTASGTVAAPSNPVTVLVNSGITSICGASDGQLTATPNNGQSPYSYTWNTSPVQNGATATNLPGGTYRVTVTDAGGCTASASGIVSEPGAHTASAVSAPVTCFGGSDGTVTVTTTGGTGNFVYTWSPNSNSTANATSLAAGVYNVTVRDNTSGCSAFAIATVTQPDSIQINTTTTNVTCFGGSNGVASAAVTGGTSPYDYQWLTSPQQTTNAITGLQAGSIILNVTDDQGCTASTTVVISQPTAVAGVVTKMDVTCNGLANGSATVAGSGGVGPYSYGWSTTPAQSGPTASGLAPGPYTVTITDANGCVATQSTSITQPNALAVTASTTNVNCANGTNGTATASSTGGTGTVNFVWNTTPQQLTATATGLAAGSFSVTATDANGCSASTSVTITQPTAVTVTASATSASCNGAADAQAVAVASAGTGAFTYSWNTTPAQANDTATGLGLGSYTVVATDANGCTASASVSVTQPTVINAIPNVSNVACNGDSSGGIALVVSGGTPAYTYSWAGGTSSASLSNVPAGSYSVTVTDANGCTTSLSALSVTEPAALTVTATGSPEIGPGFGGSVNAAGTGGTGSYTYDWNGGQTGPIVSALSAGTYTVVITDANGCTATDTAVVDAFVGIEGNDAVSLQLYPNPSTGMVTLDLQMGHASDVTVEWFNMLGEKIVSEQYLQAVKINTIFDLSVADGIYFAKISYGGQTLVRKVVVNK